MHFKGFFKKGVLGKAVSETADARNAKHAGQRYVTNSDKSSLTETPHVWSSTQIIKKISVSIIYFISD